MSRGVSVATLQSNAYNYIKKHVLEYEQVKQKKHAEFKTVNVFFKARGICYQNFYKCYNQFIASGRNYEELMPKRRGRQARYVDVSSCPESLEARVLHYRDLGYNKYVISDFLKNKDGFTKSCSPSTIYRILRKYGKSKLQPKMIEEKKKIIRDKIGSLGHVDCHVLPKGVVKSMPQKKLYVIGCVDDYSRIAWFEVIESVKAIDASFGMLDILFIQNQRYGISYEQILTDNGSEFCGGKHTLREHSFERVLMHFGIKHLRTRPYRPQTNGKIERAWRSFDEDVIEGCEFDDIDQLKDAVLGYNFYYNEQRRHQGIGGKIPMEMLDAERLRALKEE